MPLRVVDPNDPDQRIRSAFVQIPPDWWLHVPLPVVLGFHGGDDNNPIAFASTTRLHELATVEERTQNPDIPAFVTVYPEALAPKARDGDGNAWINGFSAPAADVWAPDDVGFVVRLLDVLSARMGAASAAAGLGPAALDLERLYAFGFSSGANFTYHLAVQLPQRSPYRLAGFCIYSGTIGAVARPAFVNDPNGVPPMLLPPTTMIAFHGTDDTDAMPIAGGVAAQALDNPVTARGVDPVVAEQLLPDQLAADVGPELWRQHGGLPPFAPSTNLAWAPFAAATAIEAARVGGIASAFATAAYGHQIAGGDAGGRTVARMALQYLLDPTAFVP